MNPRERLKAIRDALAEARAERTDLKRAADEAKDAWKATFGDTPPGETVETQEFKDAETAQGKLGACEDRIAALQQEELAVVQLLGDGVPSSGDDAEPGSGAAEALRGWDADGIIKGDAYKRFIESGLADSKTKFGSVNLGRLADRDSTAKYMAAEVTDANFQGAIPADRRGIIPPALRQLTLLDLIPTGTTDAQVVEYVQVVALPETEGPASEWTEGDVKPEVAFTTVDADAPVRTIAGWIKMRKHALADVAGLRSLIATLLPYEVRRRLESQLLVGNGIGDNLRGILNTTGIAAPSSPATDNIADAILRAITAIVLGDGNPNFVALNPITWQNLLLMRENTGGPGTGGYLYGTPASLQAPTIWGLAITKNRVVPSASPIVGDSMAAMVLVREGVNVLVSDSDQDDFIRNRVTLLGETRVAFPVWRPASFAVVDTTPGA